MPINLITLKHLREVKHFPYQRKMIYGKLLCYLLMIVILSACMATQRRLAPDIFSTIRKIVVVPVQPPPLILGPAILEALGDVSVMSGYPPEGAAALTFISGIAVLTQLSKYEEKRANILKELEEWYSSDKAWVPTRILANEAASQISKIHSFEVIVSEELHTLSAVNRKEATLFMENWYAPLRAWYKRDVSTVNTEKYQLQGVDTLLEVGILNYEIFRGNFLMQVLTKMVSVSSGKVVAKARSIVESPPPIGPPEEVFRNQGERFKKIFMNEGRKQLNENLKKLGLSS
ncbi:MAG: hypothetical protein OEW45_15170 [Deltaproteobacteria bacterium]|nr:hypothetical protein [Deltaproteobacteria bacterium]